MKLVIRYAIAALVIGSLGHAQLTSATPIVVPNAQETVNGNDASLAPFHFVMPLPAGVRGI